MQSSSCASKVLAGNSGCQTHLHPTPRARLLPCIALWCSQWELHVKIGMPWCYVRPSMCEKPSFSNLLGALGCIAAASSTDHQHLIRDLQCTFKTQLLQMLL